MRERLETLAVWLFFLFIFALLVNGFWAYCTNISPEYVEYCTVHGCP